MEQNQLNIPGSDPDASQPGTPATSGQIQDPQGLDDLLDEIEDLVAKDAGAFVQGFVQKGGE